MDGAAGGEGRGDVRRGRGMWARMAPLLGWWPLRGFSGADSMCRRGIPGKAGWTDAPTRARPRGREGWRPRSDEVQGRSGASRLDLVGAPLGARRRYPGRGLEHDILLRQGERVRVVDRVEAHLEHRGLPGGAEAGVVGLELPGRQGEVEVLPPLEGRGRDAERDPARG